MTCHEGRHLLALRCRPEAKLDTPLLVSSLSDWSESDGVDRAGAVPARESCEESLGLPLFLSPCAVEVVAGPLPCLAGGQPQ